MNSNPTMDATYWHKQISSQQPLFPTIEWNKPERRDQAGKLLIIGGHKQSFASIAESYTEALNSGAGAVKIILPDSLKSLPIIQTIPECILVKSTKNGELGLDAWPEIARSLNWADWLLVPGDLGNNSETAQLILKLLESNQPMSISDSIVQLIINDIARLANRDNLILSCNFKTLQKLALHLGASTALTSIMPLTRFVEELHNITSTNRFTITTVFNDNALIAHNGKVSTTKTYMQKPPLARITVYTMQHPSKIFEAATTALCENR